MKNKNRFKNPPGEFLTGATKTELKTDSAKISFCCKLFFKLQK